MIIELLGIDILLGARAGFMRKAIGGRLYGINITSLNLMIAFWVLCETSSPDMG
jgi:hypothetical protein